MVYCPECETDLVTRRSMRSIGLTAAVGSAYFLAAKLGIGLPSSSGFVSVFWPAFGLSSGVLIALGPRARWPVGAERVNDFETPGVMRLASERV